MISIFNNNTGLSLTSIQHIIGLPTLNLRSLDVHLQSTCLPSVAPDLGIYEII